MWLIIIQKSRVWTQLKNGVFVVTCLFVMNFKNSCISFHNSAYRLLGNFPTFPLHAGNPWRHHVVNTCNVWCILTICVFNVSNNFAHWPRISGWCSMPFQIWQTLGQIYWASTGIDCAEHYINLLQPRF